jgi:hypothetical protein
MRCDLSRKPLDELDWADNEDSERALDALTAERYGFNPISITAARNDLNVFASTFHDNAFVRHEELRNYLNKSVAMLRKTADNTATASRVLDTDVVEVICTELSSIADRLQKVSDRLPRRPHSLEKIAVTYLMAFWTHIERRPEYQGSRNLVLSFDPEGEPIHCSARFIVEMLKRSKGVLKGVSISTIKRAKVDLGPIISHPSKIYAFEGDVDLL